ncbi:MAG: OmpA family protein [Rhizobiales bacterium]|nr:OmpA family protein [Hyphomicrobiales bacterium]
MDFLRKIARAGLALAFLTLFALPSKPQDLGPFMPNNGALITTAWANAFGPDAESWMQFAKVTPQTFDINYSSSRGTVAVRRILVSDRYNAHTLVLGYSAKMPLIIEGTTVLGTSGSVLEELRSTGRASSNLMYDEAMATMPGEFTLAEKRVMIPVVVEGDLIQVPAVHAVGNFGAGNKRAAGDFYFLDNKNNPVLLQYSVQFTGEKTPRTEKIVRVQAGASERAKMEQALRTLRTYDLYGIHFDFDKATIRRDSVPVLNDIAVTMKNNPLWTLEITGHTDSIGEAGYNVQLSKRRAESVKADLIRRGVAANRLSTDGVGAAEPKASNKTLQGRAINRRVELTRTDR